MIAGNLQFWLGHCTPPLRHSTIAHPLYSQQHTVQVFHDIWTSYEDTLAAAQSPPQEDLLFSDPHNALRKIALTPSRDSATHGLMKTTNSPHACALLLSGRCCSPGGVTRTHGGETGRVRAGLSVGWGPGHLVVVVVGLLLRPPPRSVTAGPARTSKTAPHLSGGRWDASYGEKTPVPQ